jgi:hypothetical protein
MLHCVKMSFNIASTNKKNKYGFNLPNHHHTHCHCGDVYCVEIKAVFKGHQPNAGSQTL